MLVKRLIDVGGERAVVIDRALLAVIGAEDAEELELTTDGQRLILKLSRSVSPVWPVAVPSNALDEVRYDDPSTTLKLIAELREHYGFGQDQFRQLHHFEDRASLEAHITYCTKTRRFTASTNVIVARRLALCLHLLRQGTKWNEAIDRAHSELRFPTQKR
jgi:hypothetical protein